MTTSVHPRPGLRVHLTNVTAPGPAQVVGSLLPALEACANARVEEIFLPDRGELALYSPVTPGVAARPYRRFLPTFVSRALECTLLARRFDGNTPILVLGDVPLACRARQVVFVQTAHVAGRIRSPSWRNTIKNGVARQLFRLNASRVSAFIVQTEIMKTLLEDRYPQSRGRIVVIAQPPPSWLLDAGLRRTGRLNPDAERLELFYPAADHAHKNHALLGRIRPSDAAAWPVDRLALTIPSTAHPSPSIGWIECTGFLPPRDMLRAYAGTDGVVFLSKTESYGLPLVEAMYVGLPVVAPDLPYAKTLCGDQAIYFDPDRVDSLREAVVELRRRLERGWWPDWSVRRRGIPENWSVVARQFVQAVLTGSPQP